jgi:hypothetical protein
MVLLEPGGPKKIVPKIFHKVINHPQIEFLWIFLLMSNLVSDKLRNNTLLNYFVGQILHEAIIKPWVTVVWEPHGWHSLSTQSLTKVCFSVSFLQEKH